MEDYAHLSHSPPDSPPQRAARLEAGALEAIKASQADATLPLPPRDGGGLGGSAVELSSPGETARLHREVERLEAERAKVRPPPGAARTGPAARAAAPAPVPQRPSAAARCCMPGRLTLWVGRAQLAEALGRAQAQVSEVERVRRLLEERGWALEAALEAARRGAEVRAAPAPPRLHAG